MAVKLYLTKLFSIHVPYLEHVPNLNFEFLDQHHLGFAYDGLVV